MAEWATAVFGTAPAAAQERAINAAHMSEAGRLIWDYWRSHEPRGIWTNHE